MKVFLRTYGVVLLACDLFALVGLTWPGHAAGMTTAAQWIVLGILAVGMATGLSLLACAEMPEGTR